jgi:hypothetical protein
MRRGRRGVEQTNSSVISSATSLERCERLDSGASASVARDRNRQSHTESMGTTLERGQILPCTTTPSRAVVSNASTSAHATADVNQTRGCVAQSSTGSGTGSVVSALAVSPLGVAGTSAAGGDGDVAPASFAPSSPPPPKSMRTGKERNGERLDSARAHASVCVCVLARARMRVCGSGGGLSHLQHRHRHRLQRPSSLAPRPSSPDPSLASSCPSQSTPKSSVGSHA